MWNRVFTLLSPVLANFRGLPFYQYLSNSFCVPVSAFLFPTNGSTLDTQVGLLSLVTQATGKITGQTE